MGAGKCLVIIWVGTAVCYAILSLAGGCLYRSVSCLPTRPTCGSSMISILADLVQRYKEPPCLLIFEYSSHFDATHVGRSVSISARDFRAV